VIHRRHGSERGWDDIPSVPGVNRCKVRDADKLKDVVVVVVVVAAAAAAAGRRSLERT